MIFYVYEIGFRSRDAFRGHGSRPTGRWSGKRFPHVLYPQGAASRHYNQLVIKRFCHP